MILCTPYHVVCGHGWVSQMIVIVLTVAQRKQKWEAMTCTEPLHCTRARRASAAPAPTLVFSLTVASSLLPPPSCFVTEFQYCSTWVYNWKITKKSLGPPSPKKERDSQKFESFEFTECERQILGCAMGMVHSLRGFRSRFQIYFAIQNSNKFSEIRCQILLTCPSG